mmetsp:Transcript_2358/g.4435  ORF Transcript_2358/g.4435 Transcript_2358/m.4435 type:complete len:285 (-) Transcript_2358:478-1332(-)
MHHLTHATPEARLAGHTSTSLPLHWGRSGGVSACGAGQCLTTLGTLHVIAQSGHTSVPHACKAFQQPHANRQRQTRDVIPHCALHRRAPLRLPSSPIGSGPHCRIRARFEQRGGDFVASEKRRVAHQSHEPLARLRIPPFCSRRPRAAPRGLCSARARRRSAVTLPAPHLHCLGHQLGDVQSLHHLHSHRLLGGAGEHQIAELARDMAERALDWLMQRLHLIRVSAAARVKHNRQATAVHEWYLHSHTDMLRLLNDALLEQSSKSLLTQTIEPKEQSPPSYRLY